MAHVILFSVFDIFLFGIATILVLITAIRYFGLAKRRENPTEKSIVKAYAWIFVFFTFYLILLNLSFFYLEGYYIGHIYRGNFDNPPIIYMWVVKGAWISVVAAFIFYFYTYEKILNKRIHLAPFACTLFIILIIILPYEWAMYQFFFIPTSILVPYFMHTTFTLMKKAQRDLRAATSFIILGSLFMGYCMVFMSPGAMRSGDTPIIIYPALLIFGTFLIMSPTLFKPEFFSRDIRYWYLFSIILIGAQAIILIYAYFILSVIEYYIMAFVFLMIYIIECVFFIRFIKREEVLGVEGNIGVRGIFTKPEKITEEEVSISKEKKICLVCKGKLVRFIFMCPDCNTFYCENCVRKLSDLENMCWVCDTPFDESKPVKPFKKEEEIDVEISEKPQKKLQTPKN